MGRCVWWLLRRAVKDGALLQENIDHSLSWYGNESGTYQQPANTGGPSTGTAWHSNKAAGGAWARFERAAFAGGCLPV